MEQFRLSSITEISESLTKSLRETLEIALENRCTPYIPVPDNFSVYAVDDLLIRGFNLSGKSMRAAERFRFSTTPPALMDEVAFLQLDPETCDKLLIIPTVAQALFRCGLEFCSVASGLKKAALPRFEATFLKMYPYRFSGEALILFPKQREQKSVWWTETLPRSAKFSCDELLFSQQDFERIRQAAGERDLPRALRSEPFMGEGLQVLIATYNHRWLILRPGDSKPTVGEIRRQLAAGYDINGERLSIRESALTACEKAIRPEWGQLHSRSVTEENTKKKEPPQKLDTLIRVATKLWGRYDPDSPDRDAVPHQSDVVDSLIEHGVPMHDAKILAPLLRPQNAPLARYNRADR